MTNLLDAEPSDAGWLATADGLEEAWRKYAILGAAKSGCGLELVVDGHTGYMATLLFGNFKCRGHHAANAARAIKAAWLWHHRRSTRPVPLGDYREPPVTTIPEPNRQHAYNLGGYVLFYVSDDQWSGWEMFSPHANMVGCWTTWAEAEPDLQRDAEQLGYVLVEALREPLST